MYLKISNLIIYDVTHIVEEIPMSKSDLISLGTIYNICVFILNMYFRIYCLKLEEQFFVKCSLQVVLKTFNDRRCI